MTTTTLRPNGTISTAGTFSIVPSGTAHGVTSDDSDSTYVLAIGDSLGTLYWCKLNLGTVALPAGAVTKTVKTRARVRANTTSSNCYARTVTSTGTAYSKIDAVAVTSTISTKSGATTAVTLTQAQVDALQVWIGTTESVSGCRHIEAYVDLTYALKPTATVSAPSGTITASTRPDVAFTHAAGTDGGPQTRFHVKVFTAAQYGAGGFDPETSAPALDSGEISSAANVYPLPSSLDNGVTYRAYVKTAQTVNGSPHWSDWAFSGFSISVTPPSISSVVATPNTSTGAVTVVVNRNVGGPAWEFVTVERQVGLEWMFVRGASFVPASGNTFTIVDYEAPHTSGLIYRAQATDEVTGSYISGLWLTSTPVSLTMTRSWLKSIDSALNMQVRIRTVPQIQRQRRVGVFQPIESAFPVAVAGHRGARTSGWAIQTLTEADADALDAVLDGPQPILLQPAAGLYLPEMWVVATEDMSEHSVATLRTQTKTWTLNLVEVARPPDTT